MTRSDPARHVLVYIAGYGRSGSTFLDVVMGAHPAVFSAGELTHLYEDVVGGRPCSCGRQLEACSVWSPVLDAVKDLLPGTTWSSASRLTRHVESLRRGRTATRDTRERYQRLWSTTLDALVRVTGARVIVDSSKTMEFTARRLPLLSEAREGSVRVIHLTRDPRAAAWSVRLGGNPIAAGRRFKRLTPLWTVATWSLANVAAERAGRGAPSLLVRYEDVVADPVGQLTKIGDHIGVSLAKVATEILDGGTVEVGHGISGNRMRNTTLVELRPDRRWEQEATVGTRLAAMLAWPVSRRYGYRLRSSVATPPRVEVHRPPSASR